MIKLIGMKRVMFLATLLGLNFLVLCTYLFVLDPMITDSQSKLRAVEGKISELKGKISNTKQEVVYLKENIPKYQELQDKGLFLEQDRFMIERLLEDMRIRAGITKFSFAIDDLKEIPNADASGMEHKLVSSNIRVDRIISVLDNNIFSFIQHIGDAFPEHARLQKFELRRVSDVNETKLNEIVQGKPVNFVDATVNFDWVTMVPKVSDKPAPGAAAPGAPAAPAAAGFRGR